MADTSQPAAVPEAAAPQAADSQPAPADTASAAAAAAQAKTRVPVRGVALVGMTPKGDPARNETNSSTATTDNDMNGGGDDDAASYQDVHGRLPAGPAVDEHGLAQQTSGGAPARTQPEGKPVHVAQSVASGGTGAAHSLGGDGDGSGSPTLVVSPGDTPRLQSVARAFMLQQRAFRVTCGSKGGPATPRAASSSAAHETREVSHGLWIIWLGVGLSACLASLGFHWLISQSALWVCGAVWGWHNIPLADVMRSVFFTAVSTFFKDFDVAGAHRVPVDGPVMLVCGPHANQFLDPLVVLKALNHRRDIGFLAAASTMRKKNIGAMAAAMNAIPVERAQDLARPGTGTVRLTMQSCEVLGDGTRFTQDFAQPKSALAVRVPGADGRCENRVVRVAEVISDTRLRLTQPALYRTEEAVDAGDNTVPADPGSMACSFQVFPHVDLADTFAAVHGHLHCHSVVGIFPEGGSHDQTKMLPLKVGCAVMALGACATAPGLPLRIIPVGINYFRGHRFRSRVFVDVGEPIVCSAKQIEQFAGGGKGKFEACNELLEQIRVGLTTVTVESENFNDLQFLRAVRRLYLTGSHKPSAFERFRMTKVFSECYARDRKRPEVQKLYAGILDYRNLLHTYRVSDHAVAEAAETQDTKGLAFELVNQASRKLLYLAVKIAVFVAVSVPGLMASLPITLIVRLVASRKAKEAKKKSTVKVAGRDVMATWKILVSLVVVPLVHVVYTVLCYVFMSEPAAVAWFFFMPFLAQLTIQTTERLKADMQEIKPLLYSTCFTAFTANTSGDMLARRAQLQSSTREVVHALEWDRELKGAEVYRRFSTSQFTWEDDDDDFAGLVV